LTGRHHRWSLFLGLPQRANSKNDRTSISPWALLAAWSNRIGGQAASRLAGDIVLAENSLGGRADLAAGDFGEQHPQGQARSFMAAPTTIFSKSSIDRDAKHQSIMRSLDSEMAGGAGSELNQGVDPTKSE
jgi:hypothetical protein